MTIRRTGEKWSDHQIVLWTKSPELKRSRTFFSLYFRGESLSGKEKFTGLPGEVHRVELINDSPNAVRKEAARVIKTIMPTADGEAKIDHLGEEMRQQGFFGEEEYNTQASLKEKIKSIKSVLKNERKRIEKIKKQHQGVLTVAVQSAEHRLQGWELELNKIEFNYKR